MAKYIELANDQGNVVIDDSYNVPYLIRKLDITMNNKTNNVPNVTVTNYFAYGAYGGEIELYTATSIAEVNAWDLNLNVPAKVPWNSMSTYLKARFGDFILAYKPITPDVSVIPSFRVLRDVNGVLRLSLFCTTDTQGAKASIAIYSTIKGESKSTQGLKVYNEDGSLHFDVYRPPVVVLGSLYGNVNINQHVGGVFDFNIPDDIDSNNVYITSNSGAPFFSAYNIGSAGVDYAQTFYKNVVSYPSTGLLRVTCTRSKQINYDNSKTGYGGFYELIIHCPYPDGDYINGVP